jgi:hypothetical protein
MIGDAGEDLPQVGFWIEVVELCGLGQRQDCSGAFAAFDLGGSVPPFVWLA